MVKMKDSGIEWIGEIPTHWDLVKGKYILKYLQKPVYPTDGVITCFRDGEVTLRSNRREEGFTLSDKEIGYQGIDIGDLVVHGMDGFAGAIGISDSRGKASPVLNVLDSNLDKRYIMYYLRGMAYSDVFLAMATGIRVRSCDLRWNKLSELFYPVPPIHEQIEISSYIQDKLSQVNDIISDIQSEIETLEEYKKSVITEAVTKGLNPDVEMKDSGIEWIGEIPKEWEIKKIKYVTKERSISGVMDPSQDQYIGLENVSSYSNNYFDTDSEYEESQQKKCFEGDLLFGKLRPYLAKTIIAPFSGYCTGEFLQLYEYKGDMRFLRYSLLNSLVIDSINMSTYGTKMPRASSEYILNMRIAYPSLNEQTEIGDYLDKKCQQIDYIKEHKRNEITALEDYKKSIIYEYVTGKKQVPEC